MTYSPLMDLAANRLPHEPLLAIAKRYNKSIAQVVLRWNIERGCVPLPKSKNPKRLEDNFKIFDFSLTREEVDTISSLNQDFQYLVESKICPGI
jgi:diketogulonate reductase-like aldo/keto reductase